MRSFGVLTAILVVGAFSLCLVSTSVAQAPEPGSDTPAPAREKRRITFEQVNGGQRGQGLAFNATMPAYRWARDGVHIEYPLPGGRRGEPRKFQWINPDTLEEKPAPADAAPADEPPEGGRRRPQPSGENSGVTEGGDGDGENPAPGTGGSGEEPAPAVDLNDATAAIRALLTGELKLQGRELQAAMRGRRRAAGDTTVMRWNNALFAHRKGQAAKVIFPRDGERSELEDLSSDGRYLVVHRRGNLVLFDLEGNVEGSITTDGDANILNGKLDWALQEEIYGRGNWNAKWFSPDGKHLAFMRLDQTKVRSFTIVDDITRPDDHNASTEIFKYPKAGEAIPTTRMAIADVTRYGFRERERAEKEAAPKTTWLDLSRFEKEGEFYVVRVGWKPDGKLWMFVQDRIQTWLEMVSADPVTGGVTTMFRETSDCWVDVMSDPVWLKDGSFIHESQRSGYNHLYHVSADGKNARAITSGEWSVRRVSKVDQDKGEILFTATKDGYWNTNHYRVALAGGEVVRLTHGEGSHNVQWRPDGVYFLNTVSGLNDPGEARLCKADGSVVKVLAKARVPNEAAYATSRWELHVVKCRDGYEMEVAVLKPTEFEEGKCYPVWCPIYLGPDLPNVRNTWDSSAWNQFLAQQGYLIMRFDARCAANKGRALSKSCYKACGVQELKDAEDAVDWVVGKGWGDPARVGITGTSYGGYMSAYALTHSKKFSFGWSNAGLYDWAGYDAIYAERYHRTPQENREGYKAASVIAAAANLHGYLFITHGTIDENVHMQSAMRLAYALQVAEKPFEMMMYPDNRHGVGNPPQARHLRSTMWDRMQKHIPGGGREAAK